MIVILSLTGDPVDSFVILDIAEKSLDYIFSESKRENL